MMVLHAGLIERRIFVNPFFFHYIFITLLTLFEGCITSRQLESCKKHSIVF